MPSRSSLIQAAVAAALLVAGIVAVVVLLAHRRPPQKRPAADERVLVETITVTRREHRREIHTEGTMRPRRVLDVMAQVTGEVVWVSPDLVLGGLVAADQILFRLDDHDYVAALRQARADLAKAQSELDIEEGRQVVAKREWELFEDEFKSVDPEGKARALRVPNLRSAKADVQAARARVDEAEKNVERTIVRAPFDAYVRAESVELGSLVSTNQAVATLVGTDAFWVEIALPQADLEYLDIPQTTAAPGLPATIYHALDGVTVERHGRVEKLLGDLDEDSRLARLLVRVDDPLGIESGGDVVAAAESLLSGAFVEVVLETDTVVPLVEIPPEAVRDGSYAYVVSNGTLDIRPLDIAWKDEDSVYVRVGLKDGDRLVVSPLPNAVQGMRLRAVDRPIGAHGSATLPSPGSAR